MNGHDRGRHITVIEEGVDDGQSGRGRPVTEYEADAIRALRDGDIRGLEVLVRTYQAQAIRVAFQITGNAVVAEDVVADAFLTVYDRINRYDTNRPFRPWFYRIVVNAALKTVARDARVRAPGEAHVTHRVEPAPSPEREVLRREEQVEVISALRQLPAKQRAALILRYYLDMDEATIAQTLGVARGTVKWRMHVARRKLRSSLAAATSRTAMCSEGDAR